MSICFVVITALLILLPSMDLGAQQLPVAVAISAGGSFPVAPEFFESQWENGYNAGITVGYNVDTRVRIGGAIEYDYFHHTPGCVFGADREFLCVSGYGQYSLTPVPQLFYVALHGGMAYDYLGEVSRGVNSERYTNSAKVAVSPMMAVRAGTEFPLNGRLSLGAETGFTMVYGSFSSSNFASVRGIVVWKM
jgi:hypothetical protein